MYTREQLEAPITEEWVVLQMQSLVRQGALTNFFEDVDTGGKPAFHIYYVNRLNEACHSVLDFHDAMIYLAGATLVATNIARKIGTL